MSFKHIFLTGNNDVLKQEVITTLTQNENYTGFCIRPFKINDQPKGMYLHNYQSIKENDIPISITLNQETIMIPHVFDSVVCPILEESLTSDLPIIVMDNLHLHHIESIPFLELFNECLYSDHHIISSIDSIKNEFGALIIASKESCFIEVNEQNCEAIKQNLKQIVSSWHE